MESEMLGTISVVLLALWVFGMVSSYTAREFVPVLVLLAIADVLVRVLQRRRPAI
jgi:hypothetical protein